MKTVGRLTRVEVRECWGNEATDFTPWLAEDDNIKLLGEALGILDLEVEETESNVGPFRADMICRQVGSDELILVENQLEWTDHKHLGQIITYAAGLDASKVVWVAPEFTEEHRAALDWLNQVTGEGLHFFGVQVELWRVDDSPPAPRFHVVSKPNEWTKQVRTAVKAKPDTQTRQERAAAYRVWWAGLMSALGDGKPPFRIRANKPPAGNWVKVRDTPKYFEVVISRALKEKKTSIFFLFNGPDGKRGDDAADWFLYALNNPELIDEASDDEYVGWPAEPDWGYFSDATFDDGDDQETYEWLIQRIPPLMSAMEKLNELYLESGTNE